MKKVFVSYDHSEDASYKRLLQAWDANTQFEFEFDSRSPNLPINSDDAAVIKSALVRMMKSADYLLVLVGTKTATSKWVSWEIDRAKQADVRLRLAAVKIHRENVSPSGLIAAGTSWAYSFTQQGVIAALDGATVGY